ncbi:hypothetical protein AAG906_018840 [Vitis piasezkii]
MDTLFETRKLDHKEAIELVMSANLVYQSSSNYLTLKIKTLLRSRGDHNWLGSGSRIIVTTKDKHLLEGMEAIKGILLDLSIPKWIDITTESFAMMKNLRYIYWYGYPLESLPSSFYIEDLVELDMCYSSLKQFWQNDMV